jgi:hypothetical protein
MATVGLDFERTLSASSIDLRRAIAQALQELGFQITVDQLTRIEAKRGNLLGTSLMLKKAMPVLAIFEVAPTPNGRAVVAHLTDNIRSLFGKTWGVNRQYREIFDEVQRRVTWPWPGWIRLPPSRSVKRGSGVAPPRSESWRGATPSAPGSAQARSTWPAKRSTVRPTRRPPPGRASIRSRSGPPPGWPSARWPKRRQLSGSRSWSLRTPTRCSRTWPLTSRRSRRRWSDS